MQRLQVGHSRISKQKVEGWLKETHKKKADLFRYLGALGLLQQKGGISEPETAVTEGYQKLGVRNSWSPRALKAAAQWFDNGCRPEDLVEDDTSESIANLREDSEQASVAVTSRQFPRIVSIDHIERIYASMRDGDFVYIFSTDGFLEAEPKHRDLFQMVYQAVKRGAAIYYFFPDVGPPSKSIDDFEVVDSALHEAFGSNSRVYGYFLIPEKSFLCARSSRFVVFGKHTPDGQKVAHQVFIYIYARGDHWIELRREEYAAFLLDLEDSVDPIPYYSLTKWQHAWRLPNLVAERYRSAFGRGSRGEKYHAIRELVDTKDSAIRMAREAHAHLRHIGFKQDAAIVRWLDIGCENGANTRLIFDYLKDRGYKVALTAIDTSEPDEDEIDKVLQFSPFFYGADWTFEIACKRAPRARKFDLITCLHSWYVISPIYLVEAYRRLSNFGILLVTIGPWGKVAKHVSPMERGGNFINQITGIADELVAQKANRTREEDEYADKVISDDPYRNFAEDIKMAFETFFGTVDQDFRCKSWPRWVDADRVLSPTGLSERGRSISEFFLHGVNIDKQIMAQRVYEKLSRQTCEVDGKLKLPAFEWDFSVTRESGVCA